MRFSVNLYIVPYKNAPVTPDKGDFYDLNVLVLKRFPEDIFQFIDSVLSERGYEYMRDVIR